MTKPHLLAISLGTLLVLALAALAMHHLGPLETPVLISVGMLCGPALAAGALVAACSLLGVGTVEPASVETIDS